MAETSLSHSVDCENVWVYMLGIAQLVEHQIVVLANEGSNPSTQLFAPSPSGKAQDFDSCISLVQIQQGQLTDESI